MNTIELLRQGLGALTIVGGMAKVAAPGPYVSRAQCYQQSRCTTTTREDLFFFSSSITRLFPRTISPSNNLF